MPVTKPGVQFNCPEFREFDPTKADSEAPNADRCCSKVMMHCQQGNTPSSSRNRKRRIGICIGTGRKGGCTVSHSLVGSHNGCEYLCMWDMRRVFP